MSSTAGQGEIEKLYSSTNGSTATNGNYASFEQNSMRATNGAAPPPPPRSAPPALAARRVDPPALSQHHYQHAMYQQRMDEQDRIKEERGLPAPAYSSRSDQVQAGDHEIGLEQVPESGRVMPPGHGRSSYVAGMDA